MEFFTYWDLSQPKRGKGGLKQTASIHASEIYALKRKNSLIQLAYGPASQIFSDTN